MAATPVSALTLANAPGDGQVSVQVDAYGSFGYQAFGVGTGDAQYDPLGPIGPSITTWESAVYFRKAGTSKFLSTGIIGAGTPSGQLPDPGFGTTTATTASSSFTYAGLDFDLAQTLEEVLDGGTRVGSLLVQTYTITNPTQNPISFDLVRYYEGDLKLGGAHVPDGGGHLFVGGTEYVFQTDVAGQPSSSTTFVGITATGGTIPTTGRYEVNEWAAFPTRITSDQPLGDVVHNDGSDADEFVDAGKDYDVGIALANVFTLAPQAQVTYETRTRFGSGTPESVGGPVTPSAIDPFRCYKTKATAGAAKFAPIRDVHLVGPFQDVLVEVKKPRDLCAPAGATLGGIVDAATHLRRYQVKAQKGQPKFAPRSNVSVTNQLGQIRVDATKPELLLVPAAVDTTAPPASPPDPTTIEVDHYECYKATVAKGAPNLPKGVELSAADRFTGAPRRLAVKKPTRLCTPVDKNGEGTKHADHLLCYAAKPTKGRCADAAPTNAGGSCKQETDCGGSKGTTTFCARQPKLAKIAGVFVNDQFGPATTDVGKEDEICLPSTAAP